MKSNEEIKLRVESFTKEERVRFKDIIKLTGFLNELSNDAYFQDMEPEEVEQLHEDCKLLHPKQKNKLIQEAFSLSMKLFYEMQEGLYDPKES
jgi:hypothetical protein